MFVDDLKDIIIKIKYSKEERTKETDKGDDANPSNRSHDADVTNIDLLAERSKVGSDKG